MLGFLFQLFRSGVIRLFPLESGSWASCNGAMSVLVDQFPLRGCSTKRHAKLATDYR